MVYRVRTAFSALLNFSRSRSFMRALCNCDLLLPIERQPNGPKIIPGGPPAGAAKRRKKGVASSV